MAGKLCGDPDGGEEALVPGDATPGDVERRAMIDRGANDRKTEGDVDPAFEAVHLDGDVALVMILSDDDVELAARGAPEDRIRRPGAGDLQPLSASALHGRPDGADLL